MMTENRMTCLVVGLVVMAGYQTQQWWSGDRLVECPPPPGPLVCSALDLLALRAPAPRCRLGELRAAAAAAAREETPLAPFATVLLLLLSTLKALHDASRERRAAAAHLAAEPERERQRRALAEYEARCKAAAAAAGCSPHDPMSLLELTEPFPASRRLLVQAAAAAAITPQTSPSDQRSALTQ